MTLKLAVVVDEDIDARYEQEVLWAVATRFQADRDLIVLSGLPGSLPDPSSAGGITARMGLDATRKPGFDAVRVSLSEEAQARRQPAPVQSHPHRSPHIGRQELESSAEPTR